MEKIWEWRHRESFNYENGNKVIKKKKKKVNFSVRSILWDIRNMNKIEFNNMKKLKKYIWYFLPEEFEMVWKSLVVSRIKDYDWNNSITLEEYWPIENSFFWEQIDILSNIMIDNNIWLFDVFHFWNNIISSEDFWR